MLAEWRDPGEVSGSRQRTIDQFHTRGAGRHPQGRNAVEQPRGARLDAPVGGAAPLWKVNYRFWYLTFHSRSSRGDPPLRTRFARLPRVAPDPTLCATRVRSELASGATTGPRGARSAPPNPDCNLARSAPPNPDK